MRRKWLTIPKAEWSWGRFSAIDSNGRTVWILDPNRSDGKRFVVRADEKLTAFAELDIGDSMLRFAVLTGWREFFAKSFSLLRRAEGIWQKT